MRTLPFLLLWLLGHGGAWAFAIWLYSGLASLPVIPGSLFETLYISFVPGSLTALIQILLVERGLRKSMRGWIPVSLAGLLASAFAYNAYISQTLGSEQNVQVILLSLLLPVALVQAFWLHRRVKNAWLWAIAAMVSAVVFVMPLGLITTNGIFQLFVIGLAGVLQGIITGSTMRHLWTMEREKAKHEAVQSGQTDEAGEARLERLQEREVEADELPATRNQRVDSGNKILTTPGQ
jgi:hypothetical protein